MEAFRELQGEGPPPARLHALLCELRAACSADGGLVAALRLDQLLAALVRRPAGVPLGAARALARCVLLFPALLASSSSSLYSLRAPRMI